MALPSGRFIAVASALAAVAVVALLGLASDEAKMLSSGPDELAQISNKKALLELSQMLAKQSAMDKREAQLFSEIQTGVLGAKPAAAALKQVAPAVRPAPPKGALALSQVSGSTDMGGNAHDDKVAKLKAELAAAEKEEAATKAKKAAVKQQAAAKVAKTAPKAKSGPISVADFKQLSGKTAIKQDSSVAKGAGMKSLGYMGSKEQLDGMLRKLHCDPTSFVCSGTKEEKKKAVKLVMAIQQSVMNDAKTAQAYGWKEEHALPPAPHM